MKFMVDHQVIDVIIGMLGLFGVALIFERTKALFWDYSLNTESFMSKIMRWIDEDKIEEAIAHCGTYDKKPLAHVVKRILERSDRDDSAMEHSLDIAAAEMAPKLSKNLGYLSMVSNVVTLVGLFGTVVGLIMSFKAVSFADPTQKQTLLADGISLAMHSTAMGLMVAIPVMVFYSFLHARQGRLFAEIDENAGKVLEGIRTHEMDRFTGATAFAGVTPKERRPTPPKTA